jgi:hypothetical protein
MSNETQSNSSKKPALFAYQVQDGNDGKGYWTRIGAAWNGSNDSITIQLQCVPLDGRIVLSPPKKN